MRIRPLRSAMGCNSAHGAGCPLVLPATIARVFSVTAAAALAGSSVPAQ